MTLRIPAQVVKLGTVLDMVTEIHRKPSAELERGRIERTFWSSEDVGGLVMCTDARAMDKQRAPLYLLRVELDANTAPAPDNAAADTYRAWHERDPEHVAEVDGLPDAFPCFIGHAVRIGYRSDKWGAPGVTDDYDHDYTEPGYRAPEVWADVPELARAKAIVVKGGNQRITPEGID